MASLLFQRVAHTRPLFPRLAIPQARCNNVSHFSSLRAAPTNPAKSLLILKSPIISQIRPFSRTPQLLHRPSAPLAFTSNNAWRATHRDRRPPPPSFAAQFSRRQRFWDRIPQGLVFWGILALNGVVFLMWQAGFNQLAAARDTSLLKFMFRNFTTSIHNLSHGRIWTLATSCFSQNETWHLAFNVFSYFFLARLVLATLGTRRFLALYMGGGLLSSAVSLLYSAAVGATGRSAHGASGAIYALTAFTGLAAPMTTFLIFGIIPVPAIVLVGGVTVWELTRLGNPANKIDSAGHLGGILGGVAYFYLMKRPLRL